MEAAPELADLLAVVPKARSPRHQPGAAPASPRAGLSSAAAQEEDGTALFVARARAVDPSFEPTDVVGELCRRLDDLPLAIELAAARTRVLTPEQLLERLSGRLDLLKAGRGVDPRQQTLRATIEWSYELLTRDEQRAFYRLAVFRGGCTLEAADVVLQTQTSTSCSRSSTRASCASPEAASGCWRRSANTRANGSGVGRGRGPPASPRRVLPGARRGGGAAHPRVVERMARSARAGARQPAHGDRVVRDGREDGALPASGGCSRRLLGDQGPHG